MVVDQIVRINSITVLLATVDNKLILLLVALVAEEELVVATTALRAMVKGHRPPEDLTTKIRTMGLTALKSEAEADLGIEF